MSGPTGWWGYAKSMARSYPNNKFENENIAVKKAIERTKERPNGERRIQAIDMVLFKGTHTIDGAAMVVNFSGRTVRKWHTQFIWDIGDCFSCERLG